jgi:hypothetical protein
MIKKRGGGNLPDPQRAAAGSGGKSTVHREGVLHYQRTSGKTTNSRLGAWSGTRTLHLVELRDGEIHAIDNHNPYSKRVKRAAGKTNWGTELSP